MFQARWTAINQTIDETPEPIIVPNQKYTEIIEAYNYALGLMSNEHWKKAQEVFEGLLRKEGFANMSVEKSDGANWSQADVSARLYVAVCKNYARVLEKMWEKDHEASVA
ncbi:5308_t:CDS:2, partial [Paraglomus occultum]